ncbi:MAG TPA: hypothetical protein EYP28_00660 [Methanophagales archaeon]|nr:hypothetical protein [Methanophagales archaeon]
MKKQWYIIIPAVVVAVALLLAWNAPLSTTTEVLPVSVNVTEERVIGVHMTKEEQKEFNFGITFPGAVTTKTMNLTRGKSPSARVHVEVSGEIAQWITLEKNDFVLDEPTQVNVTLTIPEGVEEGRYMGNVTIRYTATYGSNLVHELTRLW